MTNNLPALKKTMRTGALKRRRAMASDSLARAALALADVALPVAPGAVVAGYWPMADELDPRPLMLRLASESGSSLALPVVVERDRHLDFRAWTPGDALEAGAHGTWHPLPSAPLVTPSLVLVPLLAFDRRGFRLGYGGGYYDRTLESLRAASHLTTIGVGLGEQEVEAVPHDALDQRLDGIVTEHGLIEVDGS
jgi:5-formyltetrahydrofolate cyclo-ligase